MAEAIKTGLTTHTLGSDVSSSTACGLGARVFQPGADLVGLRLAVPRVLPVRGGLCKEQSGPLKSLNKKI